ncbi:YiiX/YebB-like N1pC/P60 family cysteine hydrolase [Haloimpatiens massiliensis]|uniref:YiiX/YebB-like N1pC/P60 family cysteine hydrolase n=1 Tax=Haloimpatiens massiliensis TaxID=1658110 RepID=UPI000C828FB0|nr:YiiX/YebB-like N1pC/P60 family cysteine hydrolase [Haloimpatiens massiliensis]
MKGKFAKALVCLSITLTTLGVTSNVNALALNTSNLKESQQLELQRNKEEAKNIIENWDKIKVNVTPEQENQIIKEKSMYLEKLTKNSYDSKLATSRAAAITSSTSIGSYGDVLITPVSWASGGSLTGHAGLVDWNSDYTVESYPSDGVQRRVNDWRTRYTKIVVGHVGSAMNMTDAINYATSKINYGYNAQFANKWRTDKFYCSQLVWRAYIDQGIDLDKDGGNAVFPTDLIDNDLTIFYKSY